MVADSGDWKLGGFELVTEVRTPLLPPGGDAHALRTNRSAPLRTKAPRRVITSPPLPALSGAGGRPVVGAAALCAPTGGARDAAGGVQDPPPPSSRTNWTRLVPSSRTNWTCLVPSSRTNWTRGQARRRAALLLIHTWTPVCLAPRPSAPRTPLPETRPPAPPAAALGAISAQRAPRRPSPCGAEGRGRAGAGGFVFDALEDKLEHDKVFSC